MSFVYQQDFILRLIQRIAALVARILKLKDEGETVQAQQLLEDAWSLLLEPDRQWLRALDSGTVVTLLGDLALCEAFAALLQAEGELLSREGKREQARASYARGLDVLLTAGAQLGNPGASWRSAVEGLKSRLEPGDQVAVLTSVLEDASGADSK